MEWHSNQTCTAVLELAVAGRSFRVVEWATNAADKQNSANTRFHWDKHHQYCDTFHIDHLNCKIQISIVKNENISILENNF